MGGVVVGEVETLLISEDGSTLPVTPDADAPSSPRGLLAAGVEVSDTNDTDTVRLLALDADGGVRLADSMTVTTHAILMTLNSISETMFEIREILASLAEE